jgi:antitoxin (DNA-binding transcriptional repressor) of toxin-antitoxin stability system
MIQPGETLAVEEMGDVAARAVAKAEAGEPVVVTREDRAVAALISISSLRTLQRERELLRRLALGELESAAGEGAELDSVLADCWMLLDES